MEIALKVRNPISADQEKNSPFLDFCEEGA